MKGAQAELFLAARPTDEILREKLVARLEEANSTQGVERAEAFREVQRLRGLLNAKGPVIREQ